MMNQVKIVMTQTRDRKPVAYIDDIVGPPEMTPAQLRVLAKVFQTIADECEAQPMDLKHFRQKRKSFDVI
jgi:hypothetical protein